jgi:ABC-type phosphate transport system substrate-binding protein
LLYLYVQPSPSGDIRSFLDFALSPAGQAIVARHHAALEP